LWSIFFATLFPRRPGERRCLSAATGSLGRPRDGGMKGGYGRSQRTNREHGIAEFIRKAVFARRCGGLDRLDKGGNGHIILPVAKRWGGGPCEAWWRGGGLRPTFMASAPPPLASRAVPLPTASPQGGLRCPLPTPKRIPHVTARSPAIARNHPLPAHRRPAARAPAPPPGLRYPRPRPARRSRWPARARRGAHARNARRCPCPRR